MSWDADLTDDRGHSEGSWGYTHNCNGMIEAAAGRALALSATDTVQPFWSRLNPEMGRGSWWNWLNGKKGEEGARFLAAILRELKGDPSTYEAMNPPNGWGDYSGLVGVLTQMHDAVPEWPTTWEVHG